MADQYIIIDTSFVFPIAEHYVKTITPTITTTTNKKSALAYDHSADCQTEIDTLNNGGSRYTIGTRPLP